MMGWYDGGPGWVGWTVMTVMMLAFWGLVVFGGLALYRSTVAQKRRPRDDDEAERVLDARFARGEIDSDDYEQRRQLLRSGR